MKTGLTKKQKITTELSFPNGHLLWQGGKIDKLLGTHGCKHGEHTCENQTNFLHISFCHL